MANYFYSSSHTFSKAVFNVFFKSNKKHQLKYQLLAFVLPSLMGLTGLIGFLKPAFAENMAPEWRYSVRANDTLIQFAKRHLNNPADWRVLQTLNNIINPNRMQLGQVIKVPLSLVRQTPVPAELIFVSGIANIQMSDNSLKSALVGNQLAVGSALVTGENSKINVQFADGSIVSLLSNSTMKFDTLSIYSGGGMVDTKLRLQQGKIEVKANPKHMQGNTMQIFTPTAVAAVRGTLFRVATDEVSIRQETLDGKVAFSVASDEVAVVKGFGSLSADGAAPLTPILLLDAPQTAQLPTLLQTQRIQFELPKQMGAVAFLGKLATDAKFNSVVAEKSSQANQLVFNDLADGDYFLQLRAKDKNGLEGYDATHRFTLNARPFAPIISTPAPNAMVREANPTLSWQTVDTAKTVLMELASDAQFKNILARQQLNSDVFKVDKALTAGQYFWRVASIDNADQGPFSEAQQFTYKPLPNAPDIQHLTTKIVQNRVFVDMRKPDSGLSYAVTLSNDQNKQQNVWVAEQLNGQFNFLLKEFGKQTLNIRQIDADGVAGPAAVFNFVALPQ